MKKLSVIFMCLLVLVLVTGCGNNVESDIKEETLVCTMLENEEGMDIEQVISMTFKNDKITRMKMEVNTTMLDSTIIDNWEEFKKSMDETNEEFEKPGISLKADVNDQKYEYNTILDVDIEKVSDEDLKEYGFEEIKTDDSTLKETKEEAEKDGATCVIK